MINPSHSPITLAELPMLLEQIEQRLDGLEARMGIIERWITNFERGEK